MNITKYIPIRQQEGDFTVQMAKKLTGYSSTAAAEDWLDGIPELKRIDNAILLNRRRGSIWRPVEQVVEAHNHSRPSVASERKNSKG